MEGREPELGGMDSILMSLGACLTYRSSGVLTSSTRRLCSRQRLVES